MVFHRGQSLVRIFSIYFIRRRWKTLEDAAEVSYADDATPYTPIKTNDSVIKEIEHFFEVFFQCCMNIF